MAAMRLRQNTPGINSPPSANSYLTRNDWGKDVFHRHAEGVANADQSALFRDETITFGLCAGGWFHAPTFRKI
jgi:hypothetical protein